MNLEKNMEIQDPRITIEGIRSQIMSLGANDSEIPTIDSIIKNLETKKITADKAIRQANSVLNNKQDYH